jgi:hypothetical protein
MMIQFELAFLEKRYPDAFSSYVKALAEAEAEDQAWAQRMQKRSMLGKIPWKDSEKGHAHMMHCKLGWYGAFAGHAEASIALADAFSRFTDADISLDDAIGQLQNEQH